MTTSSPRAITPARLAAIVALAGAYLLTARLGLSLGVEEQVTAVWPPTGIALAALLLFGTGLWPGIWIGALIANLAANEPVGTALGIAIGNTLEALAGAWLLRRVGFSNPMDRLRDVLALVLFAAVLATSVSATIGVASLCLGGVQPWSSFTSLWPVWWLGDAMGVLLCAPALLGWRRWRRERWTRGRGLEYLLLLAGLVVTTRLVFIQPPASTPYLHPFAYVVFPFVIWSALRFGQGSTSLAVLASSVTAIWGTVFSLGSVGSEETSASLFFLQGYMGVVATTGLMLGAAISERNRAERHRFLGYAIARVLNETASLAEAAPRILRAICECLDFDVGALWKVDAEAGVLRCVEVWHPPDVAVPEFSAITRQRTFASGVGLPGRVWSSAAPSMIPDVVQDDNFPRAPFAAREGLHGALGVPILLEGEVLGVIEVFARQVRQSDERLQQLLGIAGSQIGQYIERREAEAAVRTSEARKAGVLASVLDAIVTIDHEGRLIEFNAGAERIFGLSAASVIGREMAELIIPARLREQHRASLARYVRTGEAVILDRRLEMPAMRADGTEFTAELTIRRVIGTQPPMFTGYLRDITDRLRIREERAQLLAREKEARARAEALAEDLREQQAAKDRFLAMLGHELRNPLAPVTNVLEILRRRGGPADLQELYGMMERQVRHMARLVDDLLDVSRIGRGTITVRRSSVDVTSLIAKAVTANRPTLDQRQHRLTLSLPSQPLWLDGDPTRIEQIVSNLLSNAAFYTPPGGEIDVSLEREDGYALLRVRDNGIGIMAESLPRIFDAFQQAERIAGTVHAGLGLGLTLVKTLAELHGGSVQAASRGPGLGSEFSVRLPLPAERPGSAVRAEGESSASVPRRALATATARNVLVVDDNQDAATSLAMLLRLTGHAAEVAYDGSQALEKFRVLRPEIVLIDIELPKGMNGHELARRLRLEDGPHRPVLVAVTGYGAPQDLQRSREAGFDHHLVKPVDARELARILEALDKG